MIDPVFGVSRSVDDEDEMLYGDSGFPSSPSKEEARRGNIPNAERDSSQYKAEPTHWCVVVRENGIMEVRSWEGDGVIGRYFEETQQVQVSECTAGSWQSPAVQIRANVLISCPV